MAAFPKNVGIHTAAWNLACLVFAAVTAAPSAAASIEFTSPLVDEAPRSSEEARVILGRAGLWAAEQQKIQRGLPATIQAAAYRQAGIGLAESMILAKNGAKASVRFSWQPGGNLEILFDAVLPTQQVCSAARRFFVAGVWMKAASNVKDGIDDSLQTAYLRAGSAMFESMEVSMVNAALKEMLNSHLRMRSQGRPYDGQNVSGARVNFGAASRCLIGKMELASLNGTPRAQTRPVFTYIHPGPFRP